MSVKLKVGKSSYTTDKNKCVVLYVGRSNHNESDMVIVYNLKSEETNKVYKLIITTQIDRPGKEIAEILERELITSTTSSSLSLQFQVAFSGNINMTLHNEKEQLFSYIINSCNVVEDK